MKQNIRTKKRNSYLELTGSLIFNVEKLETFAFNLGIRYVLKVIASTLN